MTKIFFIGDTHFGKSYPFKRIYDLNISERNLDVVNICEKIVNSAIQEKADFMIFLGDLYDRQNISPTMRKIVREHIFIPLNKNNIETIIVGGNHDSIRNPKRGADIQELANFSNVDVYTKITSKILEINGLKIGLIILPYIHYDVLVDFAKEKNLPIDQEQHNYIIAQHIFENYIRQISEGSLKNCDKRILIGHYYLDGARIRETNNPSMIYGKFKFNKQMIQKPLFNLVIFGHVHLRQSMWNDERIVIPGSIDQIDIGERNTEKFYCVYSVETDDLAYRSTECRTHIKKEIEIPDKHEDLTNYILNNLPDNESIRDSICKIIIQYPKGKEVKIDKSRVEEYFKESFHTDINYKEQPKKESADLREVNLDPKSLYQDFLSQKYSNHSNYKDLEEIGLDLLEKELSSVNVTAKGSISIKSIDMQNFNKYGKGPNKIIFDKDLYVIKGPTGAGKSSVLDAITFALFKRNTRKDVGLNLDEILYENGYVKLEILIGDNTLTVKRGQKSPKLDIKLDGEPLFLGLKVPEKEKKLEEIIGYDYEGFTSSFFIRQQELQIFSTLNSSERQGRLVKLFKLKIFQNVYKKLKTTIKEFEGKQQRLEGIIVGKTARFDELPQKENDLKSKTVELEKSKNQKDKLSKEVETLRNQIDQLQEEASKYVRIQEEVEKVTEKIESDQEEIKDLKAQQEDFTKLQEKLRNLKDFKEEKEKIEETKETIEQNIHRKDLIDSEIKNYKSLIAQAEKQSSHQSKSIKDQLKDKETRSSQLDVDMTKEDAFDVLREDGVLSERLSRLQNVEIPMAKEYKDSSRLNEFTSLVRETQNSISLIQTKQKQISKDIFIADELQSDQETLKEQLLDIEQGAQQEAMKLNKELEKLEDTIQEKGLNADFKEQLQSITLELKNIKEKEQEKESLENQLRQSKDYSLLIERVEKEIAQMNADLGTKNNVLKQLESSYSKYLDTADSFDKKQELLQDLETGIAGTEKEIEYIIKDINEINKIKDEVKEIKTELKSLKDNIEIYTLLREDIFHLNGVPRFAIEKILPEISIRASQILGDLTDGKFSQIKFKPLEGTRVGFEIYVYDGERDREASSFSGGEKTQINAAIRFAIMEKIAEIPDTAGAIFRKSKTLLIDEGDLGTLDDENARQRFVDKIFELKSLFKKIILITHLEDVAEQFPNRIIIGWDKFGNSTIVTHP
ncbi:MAG: AAA family ATPase [Promethearchaeota archaeon]